MILESITSDKRNLSWTIFHCLLGLVCTISPFPLVAWFYLTFILNIGRLFFSSVNKVIYFLYLFVYLISFELLVRMAKTSPFIPYELGKYLLVLMGIIGIGSVGIRSFKGILMGALVTPAVFYDFSQQRVFFDIINYYFAPLSVGLGLAFTQGLHITRNQLDQLLKLIWLGCLSGLIFGFIRTPDFDDVQFSLSANFATTGGHSSNQVSTVLGLGMFLSFYSLKNNLNFAGNRLLELIILSGFTFQGLLTFSRGGMVVGALAILVVLFVSEDTTVSRKSFELRKSIFRGVLFTLLLYGIFQIVNSISGGNLLLRYQGETEGTLIGSKELTADQFVTGRIGIFENDVSLWMDNFITGVGCGSSRYLRDLEKIGVAPHVEMSRLLAEHGLLGLIFTILFFVIPINSWYDNKNKSGRVILFVLLLIAITTTFHAAMRTFVTPLLVIIGCLRINAKDSVVDKN
jgi:hypothetical protein